MVPCVCARVFGGLGNQCFIYAAARALADRVHGALTLDPTVLALDRVYHRPFLLSELHVRAERIVDKVSLWKLHLRRLHVRIQARLPWRSQRWLFERTPPFFQPEVVRWRGASATLDGYWQSERYFQDASEAIGADLRPRLTPDFEATEMGRHIAATDHSVFLHVRSYREVPGRQDGSFAAPPAYFRNAVARIRTEVPEAHFFLFSDEPDWAKERLALPPDIPCTAVTPDGNSAESPLYDFHLMTLCRHGIVANSSFSWWAAWVGEQRRRRKNEPGLILRPWGFCNNADYYPDRWHAVARS
jgi:hypothetical protein